MTALNEQTRKTFQQKRNEALQARIAKLRPNISKAEANRRREENLKRLKRFETISMLLLTGVLVFLSYHVLQAHQNEDAYKEVLGSEALFNLVLFSWGAVTLQAALMLRASFLRLNKDNLTSEDKTDHPFRGWRFTLFTPILATLILLPAIITGVFNDDSVNGVGSFFIILLMSFCALLLSALVAAFIIAPIELLTRGVVAVIKGDKTRYGYVVAGLVIATITVFIFVGSAAVDADSPYPAGSFQVLIALLGVPSDTYYVKSEPLLWIARALGAAIVACIGIVTVLGKKSRNRQSDAAVK